MNTDVLLIDNIFRFIQAGMEVSGMMGQMPSWLGYQLTMASGFGTIGRKDFQYRHLYAITSIQAVYVPADDLTDLAWRCIRFRIYRLPSYCPGNGQGGLYL
ncbi:MAG: hypothetical protein R2788_19580 [Saprospiraceae bacterium]